MKFLRLFVVILFLSSPMCAYGAVLGGIVPHHDIAIDMIVRFYDEIRSRGGRVRRVFLFSPDHFDRVRRQAAVCPVDWALASGTLRADEVAVSCLSESRIVEAAPEIFVREHGITIHIPLIAEYFPGASVVPILLRRNADDMALMSLRRRLLAMMGDGDLIILSMDLSHYKPPEGLALEDERTIEALIGMRAMETGTLDIDARRAASLVLTLLRDLGAERGELLERADSSSILGERVESGTSYAAIVYSNRSDLQRK